MQLSLASIFALIAIVQVSQANFLSDEYIQHINANAKTWTAGRNFHEDTPLSHVKGLLGTKRADKRILGYKKRSFNADDLPESFDAREHWPNCTVIRQIADQSACGSCWAVATASAISDRICIHSSGSTDIPISADHLLTCETNSSGCDGGYPQMAWKYWKESGLVSGGAYNSGMGCKAYPFPPCAHHGIPDSKHAPCNTTYFNTPKCVKQCDNDKYTYSKDLHFGESAYSIERDEMEIQNEILSNGPVGASFDVYEDFVSYKSGIYQKTPHAKYLGGHAVRVLGWGEDNGLSYWLVANSWNANWGDNGLFKIMRGGNECGFEEDIFGGIPRK